MLSGWLVRPSPFYSPDIYTYFTLLNLTILFPTNSSLTKTGFGYAFNALPPPSNVTTNTNTGETPTNELADAFSIIFAAVGKFEVFTILQVWFPFLRRFVSFLPPTPPMFINLFANKLVFLFDPPSNGTKALCNRPALPSGASGYSLLTRGGVKSLMRCEVSLGRGVMGRRVCWRGIY
jgi:hypothetical protein